MAALNDEEELGVPEPRPQAKLPNDDTTEEVDTPAKKRQRRDATQQGKTSKERGEDATGNPAASARAASEIANEANSSLEQHGGSSGSRSRPKDENQNHGKKQQKRDSKVFVSDDLPVRLCREEIVEAVRNNRVTVIVGETGSGKTTQVPQFLYEAGLGGRHGVVAVTQPRRIAAISVASRVASEMGCEVGGLVGYHVRFANKTSKETRVKYMTDGMLVRECTGKYGLNNCGVVVLDEAHERSVDTDILLGLVKLAISEDSPKGLRVVVMSATLSTSHFVDFFGGSRRVKTLHVPGRLHPVKLYYTPTPEPDFLEAALLAVLQLHISRPAGDVLVFLPGQDDIDGLERLLQEKRAMLAAYRRMRTEEENNDGDAIADHAAEQDERQDARGLKLISDEPTAASRFIDDIDLGKVDDFVVRPIFAALPFDQQALVFEPAPPRCRKIILATNIAETSITIPGIRYVIDSGFMKLKICNPQTGIEALKQVETSQASARQRAGRAGREAPGEAYRLYVESELSRMPPQTPAEILRCELASVYLQLKALGIQKVWTFPLVDRPPQESLVKAAQLLHRLGALDNNDCLTEIGRRLAALPVHPMYSYCLLVSLEFNCTAEMLTIISMISAETPVFMAANRKQKELAPQTKVLMHDDGDHLSLLNAYNQWKKASNRLGFAKQHHLNHTALERASTIRGQLKDLVHEAWQVKSINSCGGPKNYHLVRRALLKGCFMQTARRDEVNPNSYQTTTTRQIAKLHPQSVLFSRRPHPPCVVYTELITTTKNYLRTVTEVDPTWLSELCPQYFG